MTEPRGIPTTAELVEAVREFLEREVMAQTEGALRFHARVAANVLGQIERELALGPARDAAHAERLAALGVADDAELARAIREGAFDDRLPELLAALRADVVEKLRIGNPRHLREEDRA
jgi:hypothetical protein